MKIMQTVSSFIFGGMVACALAVGGSARAETNDLPQFQEVLRVLRANLAGVNDEELNRAAVAGLLSQFYPRVMLATNATPGVESDERVSRVSVYDRAYGYIRVATVGKGLADQIASAYAGLVQTNRLKGLVLDLRFATGVDYDAAAKAADRFLAKEQLLLDWQDGSARSAAKPDPIRLPVAVLVNHQTAAAAEALAAVLRETDVALLIGASTAGGAHVFKEFTLSDGQKLRIAAGSVQTGGGKKLTSAGVVPDIAVAVLGEDEMVFFSDPFSQMPGSSSRARSPGPAAASAATRSARRRINEAELVRLQREGQDDGSSPPDGRAGRLLREGQEANESAASARSGEENAVPVIRDPALARALDLLKGIAILGQTRRP